MRQNPTKIQMLDEVFGKKAAIQSSGQVNDVLDDVFGLGVQYGGMDRSEGAHNWSVSAENMDNIPEWRSKSAKKQNFLDHTRNMYQESMSAAVPAYMQSEEYIDLLNRGYTFEQADSILLAGENPDRAQMRGRQNGMKPVLPDSVGDVGDTSRITIGAPWPAVGGDAKDPIRIQTEQALERVRAAEVGEESVSGRNKTPDFGNISLGDGVHNWWHDKIGKESLIAIKEKRNSIPMDELQRMQEREDEFREALDNEVKEDNLGEWIVDDLPADADGKVVVGGKSYTPVEAREYIKNHLADKEHERRFTDDDAYRNDWFLKNTGMTEARYRNKVADELELRLADIERKLPKKAPQNMRGGYAAIGGAINSRNNGGGGIYIAKSQIEKARKALNTLRKDSFGAGVREGFDIEDILTLGFKGVGDNVALLRALNAQNRGDDLSREQQVLVDAWEYSQEVESAISALGGRSGWATVGHGAAWSLGFGGQMMATGGVASAATKGLTQAVAKRALQQAVTVGTRGKMMVGLQKGALKVAESFIGAAARVPFAGMGYKNYTDRRLSQFEMNQVRDSEGRVRMIVDKMPKSPWKDALYSGLETLMEFQSEDMGMWIDAGISNIGRKVALSKFGKQIGIGSLTGFKRNAALAWVGREAKIAGFAGEVLGEAYGDAMVNLLEGNKEGWRQMMSADYLWQLGGVTLTLTGTFKAMNAPGAVNYARHASVLNKLKRLSLAGIESGALKSKLASAASLDNLAERSEALGKINWKDKSISKEDAVRAVDFINSQTLLDITQGERGESERLARVMPFLGSIPEVGYRGADGKQQPEEVISVAAQDGRVSFVIAGDFTADNSIEVWDPADKQRKQLEMANVREIMRTGLDDFIATGYALAFGTQASQEQLDRVRSRVVEATEAGVDSESVNKIIRNAGYTVYTSGDEVRTIGGEEVIVARTFGGAYEVIRKDGTTEVYGFNEILQTDPLTAEAQMATKEQRDVSEQISDADVSPQKAAVDEVMSIAEKEVIEVKNRDDDVVYEATMADGEPVNIIKGANVVYDAQTGEVDYAASDATVVVRFADGRKKMVSMRDIDSIDEAIAAQEALNMAQQVAEKQVAQTTSVADWGDAEQEPKLVQLTDGTEGVIEARNEDGGYRFLTLNEAGGIVARDILEEEITSVIEPTAVAGKMQNGQILDKKEKNRIANLLKNGKLQYRVYGGPQSEQVQPPVSATTPLTDAGVENKDTNNIPEVQNTDRLIGRSLTEEEATRIVSQMHTTAVPAPQIGLTPENWTAEFGENGVVKTPIGDVKMGENQYLKLLSRGREQYFGMIKPTLQTPDIVLEENDPQDGAERNTKLLFIKTFVKPDGGRYVHFESVTIQKDNLEVSISSHEITPGSLMQKMHNDNIMHLNKSFFSSERRLTEPQNEGSDLVPTPNDSDNKDTNNIPESQNQAPEIPRLKNGKPNWNAMSAIQLAEMYTDLNGYEVAVEDLTVSQKANTRKIDALQKRLDKEGDLNKRADLREQIRTLQTEGARLADALGLLDAERGELTQQQRQSNHDRIAELFPEGLPNTYTQVLGDIARGQRFVWGDSPDGTKWGVARELGFVGNEGERRRMLGITATPKKGGAYLSSYIDDLRMENNGYERGLDDQQIRNDVIEALQDAPSAGMAMKRLEEISARADKDPYAGMDAEDYEAMRAYEQQQKGLQESIAEGLSDVAFVSNSLEVGTWGYTRNEEMELLQKERVELLEKRAGNPNFETEYTAWQERFGAFVDRTARDIAEQYAPDSKVICIRTENDTEAYRELGLLSVEELTDEDVIEIKRAVQAVLSDGNRAFALRETMIIPAISYEQELFGHLLGDVIHESVHTRIFNTTTSRQLDELYEETIRMSELLKQIDRHPEYAGVAKERKANELIAYTISRQAERANSEFWHYVNGVGSLDRVNDDFKKDLGGSDAGLQLADQIINDIAHDYGRFRDIQGADEGRSIDGRRWKGVDSELRNIEDTRTGNRDTRNRVHPSGKVLRNPRSYGTESGTDIQGSEEKYRQEVIADELLNEIKNDYERRSFGRSGWKYPTSSYGDVQIQRQGVSDGGTPGIDSGSIQRDRGDLQGAGLELGSGERSVGADEAGPSAGRSGKPIDVEYYEATQAHEQQQGRPQESIAAEESDVAFMQGESTIAPIGVSPERWFVIVEQLKVAVGPENVITDTESVRAAYDEIMARGTDIVTSFENPKIEPDNIRRSIVYDNTLVGVHNLTEDNILHAARMGGLANPSLAIIDTGKPGEFDKFGDITLVAPRSLIDKRTGGNAGTFGADIYSPRYPIVENEYGARLKQLYGKLDEFVRSKFDEDSPVAERYARSRRYLSPTNASNAERGLKREPFVQAYYIETALGEEVPHNATVEQIESSIPNLADYFDWVNNLFRDAAEREVVFDGYTPSGNRRYVEHTLANVSALMKKQGRVGAERYNYGMASLRSRLTPKFTTLEQIKKAKTRLQTPEEFKQTKQAFENEYNAIKQALIESNARKDLSIYIDDQFEGALTGKDARKELEQFGYHPSEELMARLNIFRAALKQMPSEYFETKFERPVGLNEFAGAVVPSDVAPETVAALNDSEIHNIELYDPLKPGDRARALKAIGDGLHEKIGIYFMQTPKGEVYGFTIDGKIYLDGSKMNIEAPIHEYVEFLLPIVERQNPEFWEAGVDLAKQTKTWEEVNSDPNYKSLPENMRVSETWARITAADFTKMQSKITDSASLLGKLRTWLRKFWSEVKSAFSKYTTEELNNLTPKKYSKTLIKDFVKGVDLQKYANATRTEEIRYSREISERKATTLEKLENKRARLLADQENVPNFDEQLRNVDADIEVYDSVDHVAETFGKDGAEAESDAHLKTVEDVVYDVQRKLNINDNQVVVVRNVSEFALACERLGYSQSEVADANGRVARGYCIGDEIVIRSDAMRSQREVLETVLHERVHYLTNTLISEQELYEAGVQIGVEYINQTLQKRSVSYLVDGDSRASVADGVGEMISRDIDILTRDGLMQEYFANEVTSTEKMAKYMRAHNVPEALIALVLEQSENIKADLYGKQRTRNQQTIQQGRRGPGGTFSIVEQADKRRNGQDHRLGDTLDNRVGDNTSVYEPRDDRGGSTQESEGLLRTLEQQAEKYGIDTGVRNDGYHRGSRNVQGIISTDADTSGTISGTSETRRGVVQRDSSSEKRVPRAETDIGTGADRSDRYAIGQTPGTLESNRASIETGGGVVEARAELARRGYSVLDGDSISDGDTGGVQRDGKVGLQQHLDSGSTKSKREQLIDQLRQTIRESKQSVRATAQLIGSRVRKSLGRELVEVMGKRDFDALIRQIENATARQDVEGPLRRIAEIVLDLEIKRKQDKIEKLLKLRVQGQTSRGVSIAATVDDKTRQFFEVIRDNLTRPAKKVQEMLEEQGAELDAKMGAQLLENYQTAQAYGYDVADINRSISILIAENTALRKSRAEDNKAGRTKDAIAKSKEIINNKQIIEALLAERVKTKEFMSFELSIMSGELDNRVGEGREIHSSWLEQREEHKRELINAAFRDMGDGKPVPTQDQKVGAWKKEFRDTREFLLSPAYSFNYLLKMVSVNAPKGEGATYDHLIRGKYGFAASYAHYYDGYEDFKAKLDEKARELFGKPYLQVMADSNNPVDAIITTWDGKIKEEYSLTIGEALYVYMADKMVDGKVKFRKMGIQQEQVNMLAGILPASYVQFADWIQDVFLPERRKVYNETHLEAFGTQMAEIENYIPLKIQKGKIYQEEDGTKTDVADLPSAITGSIIRRRRNVIAIDLHTNVFDLMLEHGQQMEHWNAFTRIVQDTNALLSSTALRCMLEARNPGLHEKLKIALKIASDNYRPNVNVANKVAVALSKAAVSAKIAFRLNTALKQVLSYPAFYAYDSDPRYWWYLTKNLSPTTWAGNFRWALENIPSFRERWRGRMAGNEKLAQMTAPKLDKLIAFMGRWGMSANALVDAVTCANGAKAVYDFRQEEYRKDGHDAAEADRRAKIDAALAINETQQSGEGMYLSRIQVERDLLSVSISTFQNSNFAYLRKQLEAIDELRRDTERERRYLMDQYKERGMSDTEAWDLAVRNVAKAKREAIIQLATFAFIINVLWRTGSNAWKYFFSSDEDEVGDGLIDSTIISTLRNTLPGAMIENAVDGHEINPIILLADINKFMDQLKKASKRDDPKVWDQTAAYIVLQILTVIGVGIDMNSFVTMYEGVAGMLRDGADVEDVMLLFNAPRSQARLIAGEPKDGESLDDYQRRQGYIERRIQANIDKTQLGKWARNYIAYQQAKMLGAETLRDAQGRVRVPQIAELDDAYAEVLKEAGLKRNGYSMPDANPTPKQQEIFRTGMVRKVADIAYLQQQMDKMVVFNDEYVKKLKQIQQLKQEVIDAWEK